MTRRAIAATAAIALVGCSARTEEPPRRAPPAPPEVIDRAARSAAAIGDTGGLEPALQRAFDPAHDFTPMGEPGPSDWLAQHEEPGQTFDEFLDQNTPVPSATRSILYLQPLGTFPADAPSLADLAAVAHAFYGLEVRVLPAIALRQVVAKRRTNADTEREQLRAPDVLRWLVPRLPADAFGLMAVTMADLYPDDDWNFVFGMASLRERVGIQSFARQARAHWTILHEVGHMFGLAHCTHYECIMAGANHQAEADRHPLHACPVCLRKLHSVLRFDPAAREDVIARTLDDLGLTDEAAWSRKRARWIRTGERAPVLR